MNPDGSSIDYYYDAAGNVVRENYLREKSDGSTSFEGVLTTRDILGRVTSQAAGQWDGWNYGDRITVTGITVTGAITPKLSW